VGLTNYHKGWDVYEQLAKAFEDDGRYSFYNFSLHRRDRLPVRWRKVCAGVDDPDAMAKALSIDNIDIAVLWSLCPETFSFTAYEARAAGCFIVTTESSGNIARLVRETEYGMVLPDDSSLIEAFAGGQIIEAYGAALRSGIPTGHLEYHAGTAPRG